jgi:hypothetical protein
MDSHQENHAESWSQRVPNKKKMFYVLHWNVLI